MPSWPYQLITKPLGAKNYTAHAQDIPQKVYKSVYV